MLKISKVPFWFIWITPVIFGYVASARRYSSQHIGWFVIAVVGTCLLEACNCLHNELVDQEEDGINQPNRSTLLASAGARFVAVFVAVGYSLCLVGLIPIAIFVRPVVAGLMLVGGLAAPLYNWGPRFKRQPPLAEFAIGWAVFFGYLWGWSWNASPLTVSPVIWVVAYFFAVTSFMKDLPDARGDEKVHAPGVFNISRATFRRIALVFIWLSPYVLVAILGAIGVLPSRILWVTVLAPLGLLVVGLGEVADSLNSFITAYEFAFFYVHVFFLTLLILDVSTLHALLLGVALFLLRSVTVVLGLAPRFVEADFSWASTTKHLVAKLTTIAS